MLHPKSQSERMTPGEVALPQEEPTLLEFFDNGDGLPGPPSRTQRSINLADLIVPPSIVRRCTSKGKYEAEMFCELRNDRKIYRNYH